MTIQKVKNSMYDLITYEGDSGLLIIGNIPTDKQNYVLYMEINGKEKVTKTVELNGSDNAPIRITVANTKALGEGKWPYGVKLCADGEEDTYIPDERVSPNAYFIIKKEIVEGINE